MKDEIIRLLAHWQGELEKLENDKSIDKLIIDQRYNENDHSAELADHLAKMAKVEGRIDMLNELVKLT